MAAAGSGERVLLGRVIGLWGLQGWVRIYSDTQPPDAIFSYQPWFIGAETSANDQSGQLDPKHVLDWRRHGPKLMARLDGVTNPDQAAKLIDLDITADRERFPDPEPGSYYWSDLVGLVVVNLQNHCYGTVHRLMETGANDVLDVRDEQDTSTLIPFVKNQFVREVDFSAGRILVDWPLEWTTN